MKDETIAILPKRYIFEDQLSVDAFKRQYPAVKKIIGNLHFSSTTIHDLSAFNQVEEILGCLFIRGINCQDLDNFSNLKIIGGELWIEDNEELMSFKGLENLTTIRSNGAFYYSDAEMGISIVLNKKLVDISALSNLKKTTENLNIAYNPKLESLEGLNNFESLGRFLVISENKKLKDISALSKLTTIRGHAIVNDNPSLSSYAGLENIREAAAVRIKNNGELPNIEAFEALQAHFK